MVISDKIVIIEDEKAIADTIMYALELEGFSSVWCSTGEEGLEQLSTQQVALILIDIGLPDINGFDLCRQIRKTSAVPIIFLTARSAEIDRVVGLEIGADDYIVKPFSPREVAARVKAVLRRTHGECESVTEECDDPRFIINSEQLIISYHGQTLPLSRYEYKILALLIKSPGRVFSRDCIMNEVWEEPEVSLERTVDAHIKMIRQKLKKITPDQDPIETRRGFGYALKVD